jgi:hypothetical protein
VREPGVGQRLEAGDHVEQFLVDATLAQTVECAVEILQQFVDVLVGAFHRRQAARVLAREGFGARPEERDEKIFADERAQSPVPLPMTSGKVFVGQGTLARPCCHCASSGNNRWLTGS